MFKVLNFITEKWWPMSLDQAISILQTMGRVTRKMFEQLILPTKDFLNYHTGNDAAIARARKIIDTNYEISEPFLKIASKDFPNTPVA